MFTKETIDKINELIINQMEVTMKILKNNKEYRFFVTSIVSKEICKKIASNLTVGEKNELISSLFSNNKIEEKELENSLIQFLEDFYLNIDEKYTKQYTVEIVDLVDELLNHPKIRLKRLLRRT